MSALAPYSSFRHSRLLASGKLAEVALAVKALSNDAHPEGALIVDNATGRVVDVDFRGSDAEVLSRLPAEPEAAEESVETTQRGPGRPKLGVVAREVTLLPRHWEWLAAQPGGASVVLRKLVEQARSANADKDKVRQAQERAYRFIAAMLGNEAGLEEAQRALFAGKRAPFEAHSAGWPEDLREHAWRLAAEAFGAGEAP